MDTQQLSLIVILLCDTNDATLALQKDRKETKWRLFTEQTECK